MVMDEGDVTQRVQELLARGREAARNERREEARQYLQAAVDIDPNNAEAWLWLAGVMDDPYETKYCLERALEIDPLNERARRGLAWAEQQIAELEAQPTSAAEEAGFSSIEAQLRAQLHTDEEERPGTGLLSGPALETSTGFDIREFFAAPDAPYRIATLVLLGFLALGVILMLLLTIGVIDPITAV
ncbi:MAG: tetratricopeptide repeat protein [Ardenticatenia bacterium]|uniref:Uncharacterized protein n=1 Tax=Ardenticatena maritima TaxID=872965 RepID=A0A0M8K6C1_9CHLR|nr:tetratricopeptide repeat protein [Ardenticatena maritima]KPL88611.1 hypothetical protein SE16_07640 [Ardenticatena maritima]RME12171.1 MAG: tetratricopeptide repeat protein [Ardenticatenia bacterium]GAP61622.1 hypothetical protein ARMA_0045 [Ardenticatena maritima]